MAQMKESKTRLESENRMLIEKLLEQEKFFKAVNNFFLILFYVVVKITIFIIEIISVF